jgi:hypothetical protein
MGTLETYRALRDVSTFAGVFPSDLLPSHQFPGFVRYTIIINTDVHTEPGSHWFAVHVTRSSSGYYFDSYGLLPLVPAIRHFLRRACTHWSYTTRTLHVFTTDVGGQYGCLFAICLDRGLSSRHFVNQFGTTEAVLQVEKAFLQEFGRWRHPPWRRRNQRQAVLHLQERCVSQPVLCLWREIATGQ